MAWRPGFCGYAAWAFWYGTLSGSGWRCGRAPTPVNDIFTALGIPSCRTPRHLGADDLRRLVGRYVSETVVTVWIFICSLLGWRGGRRRQRAGWLWYMYMLRSTAQHRDDVRPTHDGITRWRRRRHFRNTTLHACTERLLGGGRSRRPAPAGASLHHSRLKGLFTSAARRDALPALPFYASALVLAA